MILAAIGHPLIPMQSELFKDNVRVAQMVNRMILEAGLGVMEGCHKRCQISA